MVINSCCDIFFTRLEEKSIALSYLFFSIIKYLCINLAITFMLVTPIYFVLVQFSHPLHDGITLFTPISNLVLILIVMSKYHRNLLICSRITQLYAMTIILSCLLYIARHSQMLSYHYLPPWRQRCVPNLQSCLLKLVWIRHVIRCKSCNLKSPPHK
jgi:hypothetical protein